MIPFFKLEPVRFSCTRCGKCCTGGGDYHVFLSRQEAENMRRDLGVTWQWFRRRYLRKHTESGVWTLVPGDPPDACVFLLPDRSCKVYASRPLQCKTYPYWPEIMRTRGAWRAEQSRCEGVDRGERVNPEEIQKTLDLVEQYDKEHE